jgi:hypothetical protein
MQEVDEQVRRDRKGLLGSPGARFVVLVVVVAAAAVAGFHVFGRSSHDFQTRLVRVKAEATASAPHIDVTRFVQTWRDDVARGVVQPGHSLAPKLNGAGPPSALVPAGQPDQVILDYPVDVDGYHGCVRLARSARTSGVLISTLRCDQSFRGGA